MKIGKSLKVYLIMIMAIFLVIPNFAKADDAKSYQSVDKNSLYSRMGGYDVISNVIDDFLTKSWADPRISHYFIGMGTDTRNRLRQKN